jgi:hypothetical protein
MKIQTAQRLVSLGLGLLWMTAAGVPIAWADKGTHQRSTVLISVYNDAGLKPGTVLHAEEDAAEVFREAGVDAEWKNCGGVEAVRLADKPCAEVAYPTRLVVRIERQSQGLVPEAFGIAYLSEDGQGTYCDVFVEPMEDLQRTQLVNLDKVLGHVMAHEIAHLLLGPNSHSPNGLMKAHWTSRTIEELKRKILGFNSTQSAAMVERLEQASAKEPLVTIAEAAPATLSALPTSRKGVLPQSSF